MHEGPGEDPVAPGDAGQWPLCLPRRTGLRRGFPHMPRPHFKVPRFSFSWVWPHFSSQLGRSEREEDDAECTTVVLMLHCGGYLISNRGFSADVYRRRYSHFCSISRSSSSSSSGGIGIALILIGGLRCEIRWERLLVRIIRRAAIEA